MKNIHDKEQKQAQNHDIGAKIVEKYNSNKVTNFLGLDTYVCQHHMHIANNKTTDIQNCLQGWDHNYIYPKFGA